MAKDRPEDCQEMTCSKPRSDASSSKAYNVVGKEGGDGGSDRGIIFFFFFLFRLGSCRLEGLSLSD